jgi:thioesterase domain-containing protein/acyl carrier protein
VDLAEVEAALLTCEYIKESAVIDHIDSAGHIRLVAFVVSAVDQYRGERAVRDALQHRLPNYMVPSIFVRLDKMPRTASGKVDRQALLAHEHDHCHKVKDRSHQPLWSDIADIWEQMLGKGPVGADDDFFLDQGASSLQAASAVVKLERLVGQRVSLATLMRFRTARSLAEYFSQPQRSARRSKLLSVQPGQPGHTPFFFVHGDIYGAGLYCPRLAQSLGHHRPFYAVMPLGFDGGTMPQSIPAMAHHFVGDIRRVQPKGPYLLGGFCNGGLVAFEMAQQLGRAGQQVAVLALIRAKPAMTRWPGVRSLIENLGDIAGLSSDRRVDLYWNVHDRLQRLRQALAGARRGQIRSALKSLMKSGETSIAPIAPGSIQHADSIMNVHRKGALVYLPAPYPGRIDVFWPQEEIAILRRAPGAGWHRFASEVALRTIPGGHHTCITEHVKALAYPLRELLDEADR